MKEDKQETKRNSTPSFWAGCALAGLLIVVSVYTIWNADNAPTNASQRTATETTQGIAGQQGPPGPQGHPGISGLFPAEVLDFIVSDRCATHILENMSYNGTELEIAEEREALQFHLSLPTRFMSGLYGSDGYRNGIIFNAARGNSHNLENAPPACREDAEKWQAFQSSKSSPLWAWRYDTMREWWDCQAYDQAPPPMPEARQEQRCEVLHQWIPGEWLPPSSLGAAQ